jgi:hypothetical protein
MGLKEWVGCGIVWAEALFGTPLYETYLERAYRQNGASR